MVLDSGATSSFVMPQENLPITGPSNKMVNLLNGSSIQASHTTLLPFQSLSMMARKADVLPGLKPNSLVSVGKLADANYTTIFHPKENGVTIHQMGTYQLKLLCAPIIQGWRDKNGLWRLSKDQPRNAIMSSKRNQEIVANVFNLPSIPQVIRYLHASAGFPTKDSWIKAIKNGHYATWPGLTVDTV